MRKNDSINQLSDAADLLSMVERVIDSSSRNEPQAEGDPWRGIRLTLGQVRIAITRARDTFTQELFAQEENQISELANNRPQKFASSALAGRIQRAPTAGGQVREIVEHSTSSSDSSKAETSNSVE